MTHDHSRTGDSDPRVELAAALGTAGLNVDAANAAAQAAKLSATPDDDELDTEVQRIVGAAKPEHFVEGHAGQRGAFLREYRKQLLKEREAQAATGTSELDRRLEGGSGVISDARELDSRLGHTS